MYIRHIWQYKSYYLLILVICYDIIYKKTARGGSDMKIDRQTIPQTAIAELASRLVQRRLDMGLSQAELARRAGVGKRTLERIESGGDTQLSTLIRLLGALELADRLDLLIPEPSISPMEMLKNQSKPAKKRKRAARAKSAQARKTWKWGDEQ